MFSLQPTLIRKKVLEKLIETKMCCQPVKKMSLVYRHSKKGIDQLYGNKQS
jgi:hypothetical protein